MKELNKTYSYRLFKASAFFSIQIIVILVGLFLNSSHTPFGFFKGIIFFGIPLLFLSFVLNYLKMEMRGLWQMNFCFVAILCATAILTKSNVVNIIILLSLSILLFLKLLRKWIKDFLTMEKVIDCDVSAKNIVFDLFKLSVMSVVILFIAYYIMKAIIDYIAPNFRREDTVFYYFSFIIATTLSTYCTLIQPLDTHTIMKIESIDLSKNLLAKESLKNKLIKKYKRRFGIPLILAIIRPFLAIKVFGKENVNKDKFPSIFICNHYEFFGPAASVIFLPFYFRPWVNQELVNKELSFEHIYVNSFKDKKMPNFLKVMIAKIEAKAGNWVFSSFDPIPVYKNSVKDVIKTIALSIDALKCGDNLLIFPENPAKSENGKYETDDVGQFYTGFAHLGRAFFKSTGENVTFYPVFVDKNDKSLSIGKGIEFDNANNPNDEKLKIAKFLHDSLLNMKENPPRK